MKNNIEINNFLDQTLLTVQKPGRYVGGEYNQIKKSWDEINTRVALVFPDIYDIGLPNLGINILYEIINSRDSALAERAYCPWEDMEIAMRNNGIPLFSLENKIPLFQFDIIGFSIPYETLYTNVINALNLSQIPLFSKERKENDPLIIAGGHSTYNPEPMADFMDAFVIGEGEEVINDIINIYEFGNNNNKSKQEILNELAIIPGLYIPSFYKPIYNIDNSFSKLETINNNAKSHIIKRILPVLPSPPVNLLVPSINVVHNRVSVEIMRGCTRGCRFCHAGMINRPVRERPLTQIVESIDKALENTGFEEVALLSLSSSDYSNISQLVDMISTKYKNKNLTISLPSLRIESFSVDLLEKLKSSRQSSFTLAPEAATDKMRNIINKPISDEQLLNTVSEIYQRGWHTIKLYFMIGHPTESLEDVLSIAELCKKVIQIGKNFHGRKAKLNIGVSNFVPKPHTPFQWVACDTAEQIDKKQSILKNELKGPGIKLNWTDYNDTFLEATLSRGDRRLGDVIYKAWSLGAKFDAWQDTDKIMYWQKAFIETDIDPKQYSLRPRSINEIFPWDHIHTGVDKSYLIREYKNSISGKITSDCRDNCHNCGILSTFMDLRKSIDNNAWNCP